uniref:Nematode cuticle collagen N-terminal domain-containing protein n=1 Tax=Panagrellus redivivus TaxID=6233 RepID=A0A7E4VWB9_PANRE
MDPRTALSLCFCFFCSVFAGECLFNSNFSKTVPEETEFCNFDLGRFCYIYSLPNDTKSRRYGCGPISFWPDKSCNVERLCSKKNSKVCCCTTDNCNNYKLYKKDKKKSKKKKDEDPVQKQAERNTLNFASAGTLFFLTLTCGSLYIPLIYYIRKHVIKELEKIEDYYLDMLGVRDALLETSTDVNWLLCQNLFLHELMYAINRIKYAEAASTDTFVEEPRIRNRNVIQRLETDQHFLRMIDNLVVKVKQQKDKHRRRYRKSL